jgi:Asp-tRNA(Asn)/Glu-tRNA(Gln) amidotransferase A subunit family amidase
MASLAPNELSARGVVRGIAEGAFTAEAVTRACLDRIAAREPAVKAWAFVNPELALRQARERDRAKVKGPLHGLPIGVKDIFDTHDMPTDMGSPIYRGNRTAVDASCVALVRAAGAVILGKTITCEFAGLTPNVTCNPHDPTRTPGGSSSGSAAAVADRMVHVAFGTQTGGSVLRPASFCGVVGYKPTYNIISRGGMKFAAESRDTIGLLPALSRMSTSSRACSLDARRKVSRHAAQDRTLPDASLGSRQPRKQARGRRRRQAFGCDPRNLASRRIRRARRSAHGHQPVRTRACARA